MIMNMNEKGRQTKLLAAIAIIAMVVCVFAVAMPSDNVDATTSATATSDSPIMTVNIGGVSTDYDNSEITDAVAAINAATSDVNVTIKQNFSVSVNATDNKHAALWFNNTNNVKISIDGGNKTITFAGSNSSNIIGFYDSGATYSVEDLTLVGNDNSRHGINIVAANVTLDNVTIRDNSAAGITFNGGDNDVSGESFTVNASNITTSDNGWGGINVDNKTGTAALVLSGTNDLNEALPIWSEAGNITAPGFTSYKWTTDSGVTDGKMFFENGTISSDFTNKSSETITIGADQTLTIAENVTFTNSGTVTNEGTITNYGTITGTIGGNGSVSKPVQADDSGNITTDSIREAMDDTVSDTVILTNGTIAADSSISVSAEKTLVIGEGVELRTTGSGESLTVPTFTLADNTSSVVADSVSGASFKVVGGSSTATFTNVSGTMEVRYGSVIINNVETSEASVTINGETSIYGNITGNFQLTIERGPLSIPGGKTLTIEENATLTLVNPDDWSILTGTLEIKGTVIANNATGDGIMTITGDGSNVKIYSTTQLVNVNVSNAAYTPAGDQFEFGDTLNSNYTVTADEYLSQNLTIPAGVTLTIAANANLNLAGHSIYIYGNLEIQSGGSVSGTSATTGNTLFIMRNGTITNEGVIGSVFPVTVSAETTGIPDLNYQASGYVVMQNVSGVSFGLANTGETNRSNQPIYMMTVTGQVQSYGMSNTYTANFHGVRIVGDLYIGQGITANFADVASTLMSSATLTVDGTVDADNRMLVMANNSTIVVNGNLEGTVAAQTGDYRSGSSYAESGLSSVTTFNASSEGTNYITGYTLTVGTYEYQEGTGSNAQAMIAQRLYAEGTVSYGSTSSTPDTNPDVDIRISGSIIVAEGSVLSLPANMNITGGTVIVQGEVNFAYASANANATSPIASYEGAFYTVTVTSPSRATTGYIMPFDVAIQNIETVDNKKITVMGELEIVSDLTIAAGQTIVITNADVTIDEAAEVILQSRGIITGAINEVDGVFTAYNGSTYVAPTNYDTYERGTDYVRYSGIVAALDNAVAGDVIDVTRPVTGVKDLTIPQGVTVNASANITIRGDLVVETEATLKMTNSSTLLLNGEKSTATVNGTLNLEEGTISFTHMTDDNSLASAGTTVMTGTNFTAVSGIVDGVVYTNEDSMRVVTNAAAALAAAAAQDVNKSVSFYGTTSSGDLTAGVDIIVDADADATVSSIALADGETITLNGKLTGAVTVQTGVAGSESASTVDLNKASGIVITAGSVTDNQGVRTYELQLADAASAAMAGKVTVSAGTANIATSGALTVNGDGVVLTVASGATLIVGEGETLNVGDAKSRTNATSVDAVVVEGTLVADKGAVNIGYNNGTSCNGFMLVSGTFQVADETDTVDVAAGSTLTVTGTLDISTTADKEAVVAIDGILVVGEKPNTVGASGAGVVSGAVSVANTNAAYIKAYNGSDLSAALINIGANGETTIDSTAFYINSELYMTVYAEGNVNVSGLLTNEKFSLVGYLTNYGVTQNNPDGIDIEIITDWYTDAEMSVNYNGSNAVVGNPDALYFKAQTATVDVVISVGTGISLYIDNIKMTSGVSVELAVGTHTVSATVDPGYTGTTQVMFNGNVVSGSFEITADMASGAYEGTVSVTATGDIQQQTTVIDGGNSGDSSMGLTDYLLIILVILIVVMAIIVALRLMRS